MFDSSKSSDPLNQAGRVLIDPPQGDDGRGVLVGSNSLWGTDEYLPDAVFDHDSLTLGVPGIGRCGFPNALITDFLKRKVLGLESGAVLVIDQDGSMVQPLLNSIPGELASSVILLDYSNPDELPCINFSGPASESSNSAISETLARAIRPFWGPPDQITEEYVKLWHMANCQFNGHPDTTLPEMKGLWDVLKVAVASRTVSEHDSAPKALQSLRSLLPRVGVPWVAERLPSIANDDSCELPHLQQARAWLAELESVPRAVSALAQRESRVDLSNFVAEGLVILVTTARDTLGAHCSNLIGSMMIARMEEALAQSAELAAPVGPRVLVGCDSFLSFRGPDWANLLEISNHSRSRFLLSEETLADHPNADPALRQRILSAVRTFAGYQVGRADAELLCAEMSSAGVRAEHLMKPWDSQCYVRSVRTPRTPAPLSVTTRQFSTGASATSATARQVKNNADAYCVNWHDARLALETWV